jgi:hypothetical protein
VKTQNVLLGGLLATSALLGGATYLDMHQSDHLFEPSYNACVASHLLDMTPQQYAHAAPVVQWRERLCEHWNAFQVGE